MLFRVFANRQSELCAKVFYSLMRLWQYSKLLTDWKIRLCCGGRSVLTHLAPSKPLLYDHAKHTYTASLRGLAHSVGCFNSSSSAGRRRCAKCGTGND